MEHIIDALHCWTEAIGFADVAKKEPQPLIANGVTHIVLLFLVPTEHADFRNVGTQVTLDYSIPKRSGATRNE
jgi:hypothetical protein